MRPRSWEQGTELPPEACGLDHLHIRQAAGADREQEQLREHQGPQRVQASEIPIPHNCDGTDSFKNSVAAPRAPRWRSTAWTNTHNNRPYLNVYSVCSV